MHVACSEAHIVEVAVINCVGEHAFPRNQCGFLMDRFINSRGRVLDGDEVQ